MDTFTQYFTGDLSLWSLFFSSLLGATLLPGGSELVLVGVLKLHPELLWPALLLGTLGNTLGGMISFGMGWLLPLRMDGSEAAGHPPAVSTPPNRRLEADCLPLAYHSRVMTQQLKHVGKVRPRHGGAKLSGAGVAASHLLPQSAGFASNVSRVRPRHGGAKLSGAGVAASHLLPQSAGFASNVSRVRHYGASALLLAWLPFVGDALCIAAGWLRLNPLYAALFMLAGKFMRYVLVAISV